MEQRQQTPQAQWVTHSQCEGYLPSGLPAAITVLNHSQCCDDSCRSARVLTRGCMVQQINLATCYKLGIGLEQVQPAILWQPYYPLHVVLLVHGTSPSALGRPVRRRRIDEVSRAQPCQPLRLPCLRTRVLHADTNAHTKSHTHAHKHTHARTRISHTSESAAAFPGFCGSGRALRARRCSRRRGRAGKPKEIEN